MRLAFELSGEHETLPEAELLASLASLDALGLPYEPQLVADRLLVIEANIAPALLQVLARRVGMTHRIYEVEGVCELEARAVLNLVRSLDLERIMRTGRTFAVRTRFIRENEWQRRELLNLVGAEIKARGYTVDLERPDHTFVLLGTEEAFLFCSLLHSVEKRQFADAKPHFRPFFSPGVIMPKIARALANLSGVRENERFLDPFCGTGGILIEAGAVGARIIGADVQEKMVRGARENAAFFELPADFLVGDAARLPLRAASIDAIATDLPYGRASLVAGSEARTARESGEVRERLYREALMELYRVLKPGRRAVIVSNSPTLGSTARECGFRHREEHSYRVHKSLTRYIFVLEKT
jgi:tRNA (guanine10-N2)-dimethyltransferase